MSPVLSVMQQKCVVVVCVLIGVVRAKRLQNTAGLDVLREEICNVRRSNEHLRSTGWPGRPISSTTSNVTALIIRCDSPVAQQFDQSSLICSD